MVTPSKPAVDSIARTLAAGSGETLDPEGGKETGEPPDTLGRFVVERRLGAGGMGVVYAGHDPELDRRVAIKVLHRGTGAQERLFREAQALAKLAHPNVVQVFDVGRAGERVYVAMQFVEGRSLEKWQGERTRTWQETVEMFVQAGRGLAAAHRSGLVHRDFKPDNVLVGRDEIAHVLDFGLARARGTEDPEPTAPVPRPTSGSGSVLETPLTRTGAIMGTPAYMSPEQYAGQACTPASDQFSFCVALYEALHGERPFAGDDFATLSLSVTSGDIRAAKPNVDLPEWLRRVLVRGLSAKPDNRFETMDALLDELTSFRATTLRVGSRARTLFLSIALVIVAAIVGGASVAMRVFGVAPSYPVVLSVSAALLVTLGTALFALRAELTRSGVNERVFACFVAFLLYGPVMRVVGWLLDAPIDSVFILEIVGAVLAAAMFSFAFDRRLLPAVGGFVVVGLTALWLRSWAIEIHTAAHMVFFAGMAAVWMRDGMPEPSSSAK